MRATTYLDNGATSFPKPDTVYRELDRCVRTYCGNAGRASHFMSLAASEKIYECRCELAGLIGLSAPERVVFTYNATYAINACLRGIIRQGDHIITGKAEHNAVMRPLKRYERDGVIALSQIDAYGKDETVKTLSALINPKTRAVVIAHASNVLPCSAELGKIGAVCKARGVLLVADCAQSAGVLDINMERDNIDVVCLPSHKGLLGIQGAGALCIGKGVDEKRFLPFVLGGNGIASEEYLPQMLLPEGLEAGTVATPAVAALTAGVKYVRGIKTENILSSVGRLSDMAYDRLSSLKNVTVYSSQNEDRHGILLFNIGDIPSEAVAEELNKHSVCVRGGLHCAPDAHRCIGTLKQGAVRASFGIFNTPSDVEKLYLTVKRISSFGI